VDNIERLRLVVAHFKVKVELNEGKLKNRLPLVFKSEVEIPNSKTKEIGCLVLNFGSTLLPQIIDVT